MAPSSCSNGAKERGESFSDAIVGEPTNPDALGDAIKVGRRGSQSGTLTVTGQQGHVAYPHLAHNPVPVLASIVARLNHAILDHGTDFFQPTNMEFISFDVGNETWNLIPKSATARFNCRYNDVWSPEKISDFVLSHAKSMLPNDEFDVKLDLQPDISQVFLTKSESLINNFTASVERITGRKPDHSTDGGTSDARFIKDYCPVIEFGLVGQDHAQDRRAYRDQGSGDPERRLFRFPRALFRYQGIKQLLVDLPIVFQTGLAMLAPFCVGLGGK